MGFGTPARQEGVNLELHHLFEWYSAAAHIDASGDRDAHLDALADPNAHAYQGIVDPNSNPHQDPMAHINTYSNAYRDLDTWAHPYAHTHMDSNLHLDTRPAYSHSYFDGYAYQDAHVDSYSIPHAYTYAYACCSLAADVVSRSGECGRRFLYIY